jgi:cell division septation protein DedD
LAQDDYYYEIQLTNKQLVFYFMAGAAGLVLSFLAGVMVGRGVDDAQTAAADATRVVEEKVVSEQPPSPAPTDFSYPQRLESERAPEGLEKPGSGASALAPTSAPATPRPTPAATPTPAPTPRPTPTAAAKPATTGLPRALATTASGFAVQVGAFKDRAGADTVVRSLKGRGLPAYTVAPRGGGLFTVRVGVYRDRADAEVVIDRLRDDRFKPYVVKQ